MDSKNLKYFIAVAQYGSISQAAKAMYISQPQLSHIIKSIEEEVGFPLFQRTNQGSSLTRSGEEFLNYCVTLQQDMDKLNRFITRTKSSGARLTVSMTRFSHTAECFNDICSKYDDQENLFLRMHECSTMDVIESVLNGYSGIGVLHFSASESALMKRNFEVKKLSFRQVGSFRPYVCLSKDHPLLQSGTVKELDIRDMLTFGFVRYIGQYEDFLYHISTENGVVDLNESARIIFVNDRAGQMRLISETNYYTIGIPEFQYQDALYDVVSVPLKNCSDHICFGILTKKEWRPSPIERDFTDTVCRKYASLNE